MTNPPKQTVTIKKYANRRLYNTATSSYVTLENLAQMVKEGTEFNVYDAKTSEDLTRSVLTQIIVEEESKSGSNNLLPIGFLRQLIGFYGDNMQWMVPKYLEQSMQSLTKNQEQIRSYFQNTFGSMFPFGSTLEEMGKQNIAMFERAMRMFAPFGGVAGEAGAKAEGAEAAAEQAAEAAFTPAANVTPMTMASTAQAVSAQASASGEEVQQKIAALQRQLSDLAKNKA
ncbi:MAG: polyhydroxyalkanoate synthesis repressor PhaR [Pseudomonadota bacterium]|nr:polyhydroxyalkanoate synthesis repressor PhaR [Pseudomonadota bacterium]